MMRREEIENEIQKEFDKCLTGEPIDWEKVEELKRRRKEIDDLFKRLFL